MLYGRIRHLFWEDVLLYKTTGAQGHSENRDVWYVYARKNNSYEYGWLPVGIIAGYFAFVARDYTAPDTNYLGVTKDERILLFTEADEEGHLIQINDLSYFFAKNDKNECGWIPVEVIGDYDVKLTFLQFQWWQASVQHVASLAVQVILKCD